MIFLRRKVYKRDFEGEAEVSKFTYDNSYRVFLNGKKALNVRRPTIVLRMTSISSHDQALLTLKYRSSKAVTVLLYGKAITRFLFQNDSIRL